MSYETAINKAWNTLKDLAENYICNVQCLSDSYEVNIKDKTILSSSCNVPVKDYVSLIILYYLISRAREKYAPCGEWVSFKEIPGGEIYYPAFRNAAIRPLLRKYGDAPENLFCVLERFKGKRLDLPDVAVEINVFPDLSVRVILWKADSEFGPEATLMFDRNISQVYSMEDITVLSHFIVINLLILLMRTVLSLFLLMLLVVCLAYLAFDKISGLKFPAFPKAGSGGKVGKREIKPPEDTTKFRIGEKIVYDIRLGNVCLGAAEFKHLPQVALEGRPVNLMTFKTKLANFMDLEKIYSELETLLPVRVERDISKWPADEKITEYYDQSNFVLTIVKTKGAKKEQLVIKKDNSIHNAIMLPFYVRYKFKLDVGWSMQANLPNNSFAIRLVSVEEIRVPAGIFKAYRFESTPKRFEIWISADERRIPLKIKGAGALGYTLVMKEYAL